MSGRAICGNFSSRVAVLTRPNRGTTQNQRAEYFPILPDLRKCNKRFIVELPVFAFACYA